MKIYHLDNVDIYVTGSYSRFLTTDVLTEFRGRGDEVHVFPLSFAEFCQGYQGTPERAWREYLLYGGLPLLLSMKTEDDKSSYLKSLFEETCIADVTQRHCLKKHLGELRELLQVVASSVGSLTNAKKLSDTFRSEKHVGITQPTLGRYCRYYPRFPAESRQSGFVKKQVTVQNPSLINHETVGGLEDDI